MIPTGQIEQTHRQIASLVVVVEAHEDERVREERRRRREKVFVVGVYGVVSRAMNRLRPHLHRALGLMSCLPEVITGGMEDILWRIPTSI